MDPTFAKDGIKERACDICGAKEEAKIDKLDASKYSVDKVTGIKTYINGDKKKFTVKFNKVQDADDYTVAYKLNGAKKWTYKSTNGETSYKMKLKAGDTIEARVCANMTVADKTFRSKYSASTYRMIGNHDVKAVSANKMNLKVVSGKYYQVVYAPNKSFKGQKYYTNKGSSNVKRTISKLKSDKRYYVKVRTYKQVNSVKYYGPYSKIINLKTW